MAFEDSPTLCDGKEAINRDIKRATRRPMASYPGKIGKAKDSKIGKPTVDQTPGNPPSRGFLGGGKEQGFVNTPIQDLKGRKAFKGGKSK